MASFEERLSAVREERQAFQQTIGAMLGATRWSAHNYEAGKSRPDFDGLIALADYFNVSLDYLVGRSEVREIAR